MGTRTPAARLVYGRAPAVARPTTTWTARAPSRLRRTSARRRRAGQEPNLGLLHLVGAAPGRDQDERPQEDAAAAGEQGDGHDERRRLERRRGDGGGDGGDARTARCRPTTPGWITGMAQGQLTAARWS